MPEAAASPEALHKYWQDYFNAHQPAQSSVAELVLQLYSTKKYDHAIAVIESALLAGQVQPWMYDVLAMTMQVAGRPKADVERALLSRLDFSATDVASTLFSAAYLARFGAKEQALKLYRQAADLEPTRPEAYLLGLRLARDIKDFVAVGWAAQGVLQAAWTKDYEQIHREAEDAALDAERSLREAGKASQADAIRDAMARARVRDLYVRLQWAGDGDLDLTVEEPFGAVVSCEDRQSRGGGVHIHDGYGPDPKNCYEEYVCAVAAPGVYVIRVRRVNGAIVGKRAQLTVIRNQGAKNESTQTFVLKLDGDKGAVRVALPDGRRRRLDPHVRANESRANLLQRLLPLLGLEPPAREVQWATLPASVAPDSGVVSAGGGAAGGAGLAVGFQPIIETIPQGVSMAASAVVSSDLRYVRLAVNPNFTSITEVFTFTFLH